MSDNMESRVSILEHEVAEFKILRPLFYAMDKKLDMIASRPVCPDPGACLRLEPRIRSLEDTRARMTGALALAGGVGSLVGGTLVSVVAKLF